MDERDQEWTFRLRFLRESGLVDSDWYRQRYPDVEALGIDPAEHYLRWGARMGRYPSPRFSPKHPADKQPAPLARWHYLVAQHVGRSKTVDAQLRAIEQAAERASRRLYSLSDEMAIIRSTNLFDNGYYLSRYADVRQKKADPLLHFVRHGARENRNPNRHFSTEYYRERHMSGNTTVNALVHYILHPDNKYFDTSPTFDGRYYCSVCAASMGHLSPLEHFLRHGEAAGLQGSPTQRAASSLAGRGHNIDTTSVRCTIIIPVYNAYQDVLKCIHSVLRHTFLSEEQTRLLILNDASPDSRIATGLSGLSRLPGVTVVTNEQNHGYTRNINLGCALADPDDVVLLNSDTIVSPHWLRNLKLAAYSDDKTGTVTAVSNNAGAFSVPAPGTNILPDGLDVDMAARLVGDAAGHALVDVPTGNGFCMYIKRSTLREVGIFDDELFPRGYGEENDFCMRAVNKGWHNVVDPGTYVYHVRTASFAGEKQTLVEQGAAAVKMRHPDYAAAIKAIPASSRLRGARERIEAEMRRAKHDKLGPRVMFVISTRTGGTPQTNLDLMEGVRDIYSGYALRCDRHAIEILDVHEGRYRVLKTHTLSEDLTFASHRSREYDAIVSTILVDLSIELLHIRHLAWHSFNLPDIARRLGIPVVTSFHDYYLICPTVTMVDRQGHFHPRGVAEDGENILWANDPTALPMSAAWLEQWQSSTQKAIAPSTAFVTTSESAKRLIQEALPLTQSRDADFHVIPHGRDFASFHRLAADEDLSDGQPLRVLLPGNISLSKGKELIKAIRGLDGQGLIEFHLLGATNPDLLPYVVDHGKYQRDDFPSLVSQIRPHIAAVLSVWPETYCHTLTECWACGIPVLGTAYGAVEERIQHHGGGWLSEADPAALYEALVTIRSSRASRQSKVTEIAGWQAGYGAENSIAAMSAAYLRIYRTAVGAHRRISQSPSKRIALVMKGRYPDVPATAYVRIVDWRSWFETYYGQPTDFVHWSALLRHDVAGYSAVVIQRDAIPAPWVRPVIAALGEQGIPYDYEVDDDLTDVPPELDVRDVYSSYRHLMPDLYQAARTVFVTNERLAGRIRSYNPSVLIRPNKICLQRLRPDTNSVAAATGQALPGRQEGDLSVVYFGSKTHAADLAFAVEAVAMARSTGVPARLYIVGITRNCPVNDFVHELQPSSTRYDLFWSWLRDMSGCFDLGIAPLVESSFSASKSYLKVLEYLGLQLPVLCSDILPYSELRGRFGRALVLKPNEPRAWSEALHEIWQDIASYKLAAQGCDLSEFAHDQ